VECPDLADVVSDGDELALDLDRGIAEARGRTFRFASYPESLKQILDAGGLIAYLAKYVLPQQKNALR
jgi:3-isopropylmalate/(R)-2-methylmalate dehydratase small subunit